MLEFNSPDSLKLYLDSIGLAIVNMHVRDIDDRIEIKLINQDEKTIYVNYISGDMQNTVLSAVDVIGSILQDLFFLDTNFSKDLSKITSLQIETRFVDVWSASGLYQLPKSLIHLTLPSDNNLDMDRLSMIEKLSLVSVRGERKLITNLDSLKKLYVNGNRIELDVESKSDDDISEIDIKSDSETEDDMDADYNSDFDEPPIPTSSKKSKSKSKSKSKRK